MINIAKKDGSIENMSIDEFSRWMCLAEAFYFIEEKANELKIDIETMLKPLAIDAYIKERFDAMKHDVSCEMKLGNI
jgi:hypothetical protein